MRAAFRRSPTAAGLSIWVDFCLGIVALIYSSRSRARGLPVSGLERKVPDEGSPGLALPCSRLGRCSCRRHSLELEASFVNGRSGGLFPLLRPSFRTIGLDRWARLPLLRGASNV